MKFSIMHKLLLLVALPIITLVIFSADYINDKYNLLNQHRIELSHLDTIQHISNLIHELQIERGISFTHLNSDNAEYYIPKIKAQRSKTDEALKIYKRSIESLDKKTLSSSNIKFITTLDTILSSMADIRLQVSQKSIEAKKSFRFYTFLNKNLLSLIKGFSIHTNSYEANSKIIILTQLFQFQELAGQERALIASFLESKKAKRKDLQNFHKLTSLQKSNAEQILFLLQGNKLHDEIHSLHQRYTTNSFIKVRQHILNYEHNLNQLSPAKLTLDAQKWFEISSQRINDLHKIEGKLFQQIYQYTRDDISATYSALKLQIFTTLLTVLIILTAMYIISRNIKNSIKELGNGMNDFFKFLNFETTEINEIDTHSSDEINEMAKKINKNSAFIQQNHEKDRDFINEITQIVMLMKDGDFTEQPYFEPHHPNLKELKSVFQELIDLITAKLKEQTEELQKLNSSLEDRVYYQTMELEEQIKEITLSRDKAIQAEIAKDEFLANMSHEIRTPLNAILGFVTILKKRITEEKSLNYLNIIDTSGKSLLTIINDILDFSKIQSGKFTISKHGVEPVEEFSTAVMLFASKAYEKHIIYSVYIDPNMPSSINIDSTRIKQVLSNLLSNAIKFTPEDGAIKVKVVIKNNHLIISIQDNGIGVSKEHQKKIFSAFEQADGSTTRKYGGTGLGLSISSKLAALMEGDLSLVSEPNKGSTFTLKIPIEILNANPKELIEINRMKEYTFAILNNCVHSQVQTKLLKKYLQDFGVVNIVELDSFSETDYDILIFIPDDEYNEEIVLSNKPTIAVLRTNSIKLATHEHIEPLYAPFTPKLIVEAINNLNIDATTSISSSANYAEEDEEQQYNGHILVAEDNKTNQTLIRLILMDYGLKYDIANDGVEAVSMFKKGNYDIVLMDENMPKLNGIIAMEQIKEYEKENSLVSTPIVALTASVLDTDKERFLNAGMDGFIGKPIDTKELEALFNLYLEKA